MIDLNAWAAAGLALFGYIVGVAATLWVTRNRR